MVGSLPGEGIVSQEREPCDFVKERNRNKCRNGQVQEPGIVPFFPTPRVRSPSLATLGSVL